MSNSSSTPNSASVKCAFLETAHGIAGGDRRLRLLHPPQSSDQYRDAIQKSRTVPIPEGMVPGVGQMPEAGAAAGVGLLRGDAE